MNAILLRLNIKSDDGQAYPVQATVMGEFSSRESLLAWMVDNKPDFAATVAKATKDKWTSSIAVHTPLQTTLWVEWQAGKRLWEHYLLVCGVEKE